MYGWRGKIGLVKPTLRGKAFAFWYSHAPQGIEILPTYVGYRRGERDPFQRGLQRIDELADELVTAGADVICVSGAPPFLLQATGFESEWAADIERRIRRPVVAPLRPHADAMTHLGMKRIVVATYYHAELNERLVEYLRAAGIECTVHSYPGRSDEELYSVPLAQLEAISWQDVYRHCRTAYRQSDGCDGIYIHGAGWDAPRAIEPLEQDLAVPVVFGPAAEMWATYRMLGIHLAIPDAGQLLRGQPPD